MEYIDFILEELKKLSAIPSPSGYTAKAAQWVCDELTAMGYEPRLTNKGGVLCDLGGEDADNGLLLSAHIDTLGGMVSSIKPSGRLKISPIGGLQPQNTEAENVIVITRDGRQYEGTFQLANASAHVNKEYAKQERTFDTMEIVLDEPVSSKEDIAALGIENGCYVCFDPRTVITKSGYIKSRFLDDKLSVAILLGYAKYLKDEAVHLPRRTYFHITVFEEVGHGGAVSVPKGVTEMLAVDMGCVGEGLDCTERMVSICAKNSAGPSNYEITSQLISLCKECKLDYAVDIYPFYSSDADMALKSNDIRHALIGAGVYASHGYERTHIDGVKNTFYLLCAYTK